MARKETKAARRKGRKAEPLKIAALVVSAIQELRETKGSTPKKITRYISYASSMPEKTVKRQVKTALNRGVQYGILRRHRGHYFLLTSDELDRANRVAVQFARLQTPASSSLVGSKTNSVRKMKDRRTYQKGIDNRARRDRKGQEVRSVPSSISTVSSLMDEITDDIVSTAE